MVTARRSGDHKIFCFGKINQTFQDHVFRETMSKVTGLSPMEGNGLDLAQRDPNNLNEHLQVMWDDVFGEPEGVRSNDCAWRTSYKCFHGTRSKEE